MGSQPRVAAGLLCLLLKPKKSRGLGEAPRSAPKPIVGVVEAWWWSGASRAWLQPTICLLESSPVRHNTRARAHSSDAGRHTQTMAQCSRRWLSRVHTRAKFVTRRFTGAGREREPFSGVTIHSVHRSQWFQLRSINPAIKQASCLSRFSAKSVAPVIRSLRSLLPYAH